MTGNDSIAKKGEPKMDRLDENVVYVSAIFSHEGHVPLLGQGTLEQQGEVAGYILICATIVGVAVWGLAKLFKK